MGYTKEIWKDRNVQYPNRYKDQNNNTLTLTRDEGTVTEAGTLFNAAKMNNIEDGVEAISQYITATATTNGDYKINISSNFTLAAGLKLNISFPAATTNTQNARLSIDDGANYKNIKTTYLTQIIAKHIESRVFELRYDGTQWLCEELDALYTSFYAYMANNTSTANLAVIVMNTEEYDIGGNFNNTTYRFTAPVNGIYQFNTQISVASPTDQQRYGYVLIKDGDTANNTLYPITRLPASGTNALYINLSAQMYLPAGSYVYLFSQFDATKDVVGAKGITYFQGHLIKKVTI